MNLCGNLFCSDYPGDIMRVNAREIPNKTSIVYDMGSHETRISREIRQRKFLRHDLIGYLQPGCAKRRPSWRNVLRLKDVPCLNDHKLLPNPVLPGSAYVCMAIEALSQHVSGQHKILGKHSFKLRNVLIRSALQIPQNDTEASHGTILLERCIDPNTDPELLSEIVRRERFFYLNDFERELAVKDGIVYISRLIFDEELNVEYRERYNSQKETALEPMGSHAALRAHFSKPGLISSLVFQSDKSMLEPLQPDYMEIRTAAIGLNWKDLASSTGKIDMDTLSSECSSIITKRGSVVQGLRPGDHIYGLAWANFGTTIRLPAGFAQKMRPEDCFEEMVGVPIIFCTAHYGLNHLARLEGGERVLIQGATGGVGLAAIQVARSIGADIYVTAGNQAKVDFLHEQIGFEKERILSSRNEDGLLRIPSITNGRGFDAILSTSTGSMMHESWRYLAPRGRFIDVGRIDVQNGATLSMEVFRRNALYASYDLSIMARQDAAFSARYSFLYQ
jgi:NADPH:quinone reductase-like Zn-dependent oxidoreductase